MRHVLACFFRFKQVADGLWCHTDTSPQPKSAIEHLLFGSGGVECAGHVQAGGGEQRYITGSLKRRGGHNRIPSEDGIQVLPKYELVARKAVGGRMLFSKKHLAMERARKLDDAKEKQANNQDTPGKR